MFRKYAVFKDTPRLINGYDTTDNAPQPRLKQQTIALHRRSVAVNTVNVTVQASNLSASLSVFRLNSHQTN